MIYKVNLADRITVNIFIQTTTDGNWRIVPSTCMLKQGKLPCTGNIYHPCQNKFDTCNARDKTVCTDEIGRLRLTNNEKLPDNIKIEWAKFARESWSVKSYIRSQSLKFDDKTQQFIFDEHRFQQLTIKFLLKEWSLGQYDSTLVIQDGVIPGLQFTPGVPAKGIPDEQMMRIAEIDGDIMDAFYTGFRNTRSFKEII